MDSHAFLENPEKHKLQHVYILHGEEEFLKRQVLSALRARVLESAENSFGLSTYSGDSKQLTAEAARLLVDLIGPDMGQLDQELLKLAIYVGTAKRIDNEDVDKLVGSSRGQSMWKIFDAIGAGQSSQALVILDRLF